MHKLTSSDALRRFRIASLLVLVMFATVPFVIGFALGGLLLGEHRWFLLAGVAMAVGLFCALMNFLLGMRLKCPLCMMPPLLNRHCSKHRNASKMFGSYKLRVACSIIFKRSFRCPYCGEPTAMQVRERRPR